MNKAIFLDRDGTINVEKHYMYRSEDFEFVKNSELAIKKLKDLGYIIIVVTNQSGIARGYYTLDDVEKLHRFMNEQLMNKTGVMIDAFFTCPHAEWEQCMCRKPKVAMHNEAQKRFHIDYEKSYVVGDKTSDIKAAKKLKSKYGLVLTGYGNKQDTTEIDADCIYDDLYNFAIALEQQESRG